MAIRTGFIFSIFFSLLGCATAPAPAPEQLRYPSEASSEGSTDYCVTWQLKNSGRKNYNVLYAKCTNTPKATLGGLMPVYVDFQTRLSLGQIGLEEAKNNMDLQLTGFNFKKAVDIGTYSIYSNRPTKYANMCIHILNADPRFEAPIQCTPGSTVSTDLNRNQDVEAAFESNGFRRIGNAGPSAPSIPAFDIYAK